MKENTSLAQEQFLFGKSLRLKVSEGKSEIERERKEGTEEERRKERKQRGTGGIIFQQKKGKTTLSPVIFSDVLGLNSDPPRSRTQNPNNLSWKEQGEYVFSAFNGFIIIEQGVKGYNYLDMHLNYCFSNQGCTKESPKRYKKVSTCYSSQIKQRIWNLFKREKIKWNVHI